MFLSRLHVDTGNDPDRPRPGRQWLHNLYHVHQRLCMAFPSASVKSDDPHFLKPFSPGNFEPVHAERSSHAGFLFRIDPQPGGSVVILVQSGGEPDWDYAFHNAGHLLAALPEVKPFDPTFTKGQRLAFRLRANPTKRLGKSAGDDKGKRVGIYDEQKQIEWLQSKGEAGGFGILSVQVVPDGFIHGKKTDDQGPHDLKHYAVRFEGVVQVTEPAAFLQTLQAGIGSGKAFGFGLLSVAPVPAVG